MLEGSSEPQSETMQHNLCSAAPGRQPMQHCTEQDCIAGFSCEVSNVIDCLFLGRLAQNKTVLLASAVQQAKTLTACCGAGWLLFMVFAGVGLVAFPVDCIKAFVGRPRSIISRSEFIKRAQGLGNRAKQIKARCQTCLCLSMRGRLGTLRAVEGR